MLYIAATNLISVFFYFNKCVLRITKNIWLLSIVSMFADIAGELFYTITPLYMQSIGISIAAIGIVEGIAEIIAGLTKGYFGNWSDAIQRRVPFIKVGYLLSAISKPFIVLSNAIGWIFFVRTIDRLGKGVRTAARDALLSNEATVATKARVFAFHRAWDTVGAIIGPVIVVVVLYFNLCSIKELFLLGIIPGLLAVLLIFFIKEKKQQVAIKKRPSFFSFFNYWHKSNATYKYITIAMCVFYIANSSDVFLILKSKEIVKGDETIYLIIMAYVVYNIVYATTSYPIGKLADRYDKRIIVVVGLIIFSLVYIGFAFATTMVHIFILFAIYGLYAAATEGVVKAWLSNCIPQNEQATGLGLFASLQSLTIMLASIIAGFVWQELGSGVVFVASGTVAAIVAIWFYSQKKLTVN